MMKVYNKGVHHSIYTRHMRSAQVCACVCFRRSNSYTHSHGTV